MGNKMHENSAKEEKKATDDDIVDLSQIVTDLGGKQQNQKFAVLLHNVFSPQECNSLIQRSEAVGFEEALVNVGHGQQHKMDHYRKSHRCILDDPDLAEVLYQRILTKLQGLRDCVLQREEYTAVGCNERLRILRYDPGDFFKPHIDGCYVRGKEAGEERRGETSEVTVLLYLNQGYKGGHTSFLDRRETVGFDVVPESGSVLLFDHNCYHEGSLLEKGRKYVVRTEIMYTAKGSGYEYSKGLHRTKRAKREPQAYYGF